MKVVSERRAGDKTSVEARYFISSLESDAKRLLEAIRAHWGIENGLHWVLDIAFREDESRIRKGNGPQNFAVLRHIALNLLKCGQPKAGCPHFRLLRILAILSTTLEWSIYQEIGCPDRQPGLMEMWTTKGRLSTFPALTHISCLIMKGKGDFPKSGQYDE